MQGHVRQRGDRWQVIVNVGRDPKTGKRRVRSGTAATKKEAFALRNRLIAEVGAQADAGGGAPGTDATMAELWEEYMECAGPPSKTSRSNYARDWKNHLAPAIANIPARKLRPADLNRIYVAKREAGYKPSSIRHMHTVVSAMCTYGLKNEWLVTHPAGRATPPHVPKTAVRATATKDIFALLDALEGTVFGLFAYVSAALGTRRGETLGLQWSDIDFDRGEVTIARRVAVVPGGIEVLPFTKGGTSRKVSVDAGTLVRLRNRMVEAQALVALVEGNLPASAYVFARATDLAGFRPMHPSSVTHHIGKAAKRLGIKANLHGLRHAAATRLIANGVDVRTVSERLGNSPDVVLRVYSHFVPAADRAAADILGRALSDRPSASSEARSGD